QGAFSGSRCALEHDEGALPSQDQLHHSTGHHPTGQAVNRSGREQASFLSLDSVVQDFGKRHKTSDADGFGTQTPNMDAADLSGLLGLITAVIGVVMLQIAFIRLVGDRHCEALRVRNVPTTAMTLTGQARYAPGFVEKFHRGRRYHLVLASHVVVITKRSRKSMTSVLGYEAPVHFFGLCR
ncbi:hypothetical protein, partial [Streptomyces sp. NPDC058623]|uniref:hypothetical protein n=1 Tax=Streptomyces sp. NPDC058623 TaxID=3346563 RepID=UPI00364D78B5